MARGDSYWAWHYFSWGILYSQELILGAHHEGTSFYFSFLKSSTSDFPHRDLHTGKTSRSTKLARGVTSHTAFSAPKSQHEQF